MKLTQAEIDALFAQYSGNPEALETPAQPGAAPDSAGAVPEAAPPTPGAAGAPMGAVPTGAGGTDGPTSPQGEQPAAPASFPSLRPTPVQMKENPALGVLANVELDVSVSLGHTRRSIREILSLGAGSVLELDTLAGEAVEIEVNGRVVARGEVVVVGENYGVRITELVSPDGGQTG